MPNYMENFEKQKEQQFLSELEGKKREKRNRCKVFLKEYTPLKMERELSEYVVGQPELIREVANFLYYHAFRQVFPQLPVRNLLIAGSSGSGKTEVFRCAKRLYGELINIKISDGSRITKEGWSGSQKLEGMLEPELDVLVVDEADKLCTPSYTSGGGNVSKEIQSEFLKLMEGEYEVVEKRKPSYVLSGVSVVLVGAFESIREKKNWMDSRNLIGFGTMEFEEVKEAPNEISDDDLIKFGVLPELLGRIAVKVVTNDLTNEDYLQILKNPHGRVATLLEVLEECGISSNKIMPDEEIIEMIEKSRGNRTGFRWVSAQVENKILEVIREEGVMISEEEPEPEPEGEALIDEDDDDLWSPGDDLFD